MITAAVALVSLLAAAPAPSFEITDVTVYQDGAYIDTHAYHEGELIGTVTMWRHPKTGHSMVTAHYPDGLYFETDIDLMTGDVTWDTNALTPSDEELIRQRTEAMGNWLASGEGGPKESWLKCGATFLLGIGACLTTAGNPLTCAGMIIFAYCECGVDVKKTFDLDIEIHC